MIYKVTTSRGRSEHVGAGGTFQIDAVRDETGKIVNGDIDLGFHHLKNDSVEKAVKAEFGEDSIVQIDEE